MLVIILELDSFALSAILKPEDVNRTRSTTESMGRFAMNALRLAKEASNG